MLSYCTFCKLTLRSNIKECCRYQKYSIMDSKLDNTNNKQDLLTISSSSPIVSFYKGKSVLVTGATGFIGSVLIEKLLYTCTDIKAIYILIRPKKGKSSEERFDEYIESPVFQRVRESRPTAMRKLKHLAGDLQHEQLGLTTEAIKMLQNEVSVVFHSAANVAFNMTLKEAVDVNLRTTHRMIDFCRGLQNLKTFVYVSTSYNNYRRLVEEKVYKTEDTWESFYYLADNINYEYFRREILGGRPNSYSLAKGMAEVLIEHETKEMPTAIVRPSAVISSNKEPVEGWLYKNWNGPNGTIAAIGKCALRCWNGDPDCVADLIPVDTVTNLLIAAAWDTNNRWIEGEKEIKVFNCCSGVQNPITVGKFMSTCLYYTRKHAFEGTLFTPILIIINNRHIFSICWFFLQIVPAYVIDGFSLLLRGKQSIAGVTTLKKMTHMLHSLNFFTCNQFIFSDYNVKTLYGKLDKSDKILFDFDIKNINWDKLLENYILGLKKYLLKEQ